MFVDCTFVGCKMLAVSWTATGAGSMLAQPLRFEHCRLDGTTFVGLDLTGFVFRDCRLIDVDLTGADLRRADLGGSDLSGARFAGTDLRERVPLSEACGRYVDWYEVPATTPASALAGVEVPTPRPPEGDED